MSRFDELARQWDVAPIHHDRTNDVAQKIRETLTLQGRTALEVGAGTGLLAFALADSLASVVVSDPSAGMVTVLQEKIIASGYTHLRAVQCGDDLTGIDGRFDLIVSQMALHHIGDVEGFLERALERLTPDGWLAIADLDTEDGSFHGPEVTDVHFGFDRTNLQRSCQHLGYVDISFTTAHVMRRPVDGALREYPIFLLLARKPQGVE